MTLTDCLTHIRVISDGLADEIASLGPDRWDGPTNCPPWKVRDLASHLVSSGQGFVRSIRRGLSGQTEPAPPPTTPTFDEAQPASVAHALEDSTDDFLALYDGLDDAQLETICFHRRGNRSVRWYAAHRLAEVTFHGWDLHTSLGRPAVVREDVAALLLPTLLESNVPRTYAAGLSAERGRGERYLLRVAGMQWRVTIDPDDLVVEPGEDGPADVTISASAATLSLLVYGRATLADAHVSGDPIAIARFSDVFPRP